MFTCVKCEISFTETILCAGCEIKERQEWLEYEASVIENLAVCERIDKEIAELLALFKGESQPEPEPDPVPPTQAVNPINFHPVQKRLWRAIETAHTKAHWFKPETVWLGGNEYSVLGSDGITSYTVTLVEGKNHLTGLEKCDCAAGRDGMVCYHKASAVNLRNLGLCLTKGCKNKAELEQAFCVDCLLEFSLNYQDATEQMTA